MTSGIDGDGRRQYGRRRVAALAAAATLIVAVVLAGCGDDQPTAGSEGADVRGADEVQVMSPEEAQALLAGGEGDEPAVSESSRSFQTRLGTALTVFNACLRDEGFDFLGLPGQSDDPAASDPAYLAALITCNNQSGIGDIIQEQQASQAWLTAEQKTALNTAGREVFGCLGDRGWDFGQLTPNENGILTASTFPDIPVARQDEFQRDLDECGWNDLDLG